MDDFREPPPYEAYAVIAGTFLAGLGVVSALARRSPPARALDLIALSAATFKASRTLSHERVASFVREPFVEGKEERPAGEGLQRALGELVTCSRVRGDMGRGGSGLHADSGAEVRAGAHVDAGRRGRERLPAGGVLGAVCEGERAGRPGTVDSYGAC